MVFPTRAMHRSIAMGVGQTDGQTDRNIAYCPSYGRQTVDDDAIFTALYRANCLAS